MKRILLILLVVLLLSVNPLSAGTKWKILRQSVSTNTALLLPAGTWVYGISLHATSTNAQMSIYNSATLGGTSTPIDEIGEPTQYNTVDFPWPDPIYFSNGVTVIISNGVGFVSYASTS